MIDSSLLGQTAARCMEYLDETPVFDGGSLVSVGIIVICEAADGETTLTRTFCSDTRHYQQVGLMHMGMTCVVDGVKTITPHDMEDDDPEEDD